MPAGSMLMYDAALYGLLKCNLPNLETAPITAVLLSAAHIADLASHSVFADITQSEITGFDYARRLVTGGRIVANIGGPSFHSDTIQFGNPVTLGPAKYMAFIFGMPVGLKANSQLLGIASLAESGVVEAQRSNFALSPPASGWFQQARA